MLCNTWLPFLNISGFISVVACVSYSLCFFDPEIHHCVCTTAVHSPASGCLNHFLFSAIMNSTSMNSWMIFCMNVCLYFFEDIKWLIYVNLWFFLKLPDFFQMTLQLHVYPGSVWDSTFSADCSTLINIFFVCSFFWDRISLHHSGYPGTHLVD